LAIGLPGGAGIGKTLLSPDANIYKITGLKGKIRSNNS